MYVTLAGEPRLRFRRDLMAHRARSSLSDLDYATRTLKISLNTLKKCLSASDDKLAIRRQTFNAIISNAGLDVTHYIKDAAAAVPPSDQFGGYTKAEGSFIVGQYFLFRRSFLTAENITRSVLDIRWHDTKQCLGFEERLRYTSDSGVPQSVDVNGDIYIHVDRVLMSLVSFDKGEARMTMLHLPSKRAVQDRAVPTRFSGVLLTHGYPKRFYQPVVSAVTVEEVPRAMRNHPLAKLSKMLKPGSPEFDAADKELTMAEDHAVVMTPLMRRQLKR